MTKLVLKLEFKNYETYQKMNMYGGLFKPWWKPWVAEIYGIGYKYPFSRKFINGQIDISDANSKFTRGVYLFFFLEEGKVYEISENGSVNKKIYQQELRNEHNSKKYMSYLKENADNCTYYCRYENGKIIKMTYNEVFEWVKKYIYKKMY